MDQRITELEAELARARQRIVELSNQAVMAELATGVLHNVSNVLSSVNVSAALLSARLKNSKATNLAKAASMLEEHSGELGDFLTRDPKGKQLPDYFAQLAKHLASEQAAAVEELHQLSVNIEHIREIVAMQQSYAKVSGVEEPVAVAELLEDALRLNAEALAAAKVDIVREFGGHLPPITVDRHKVLQILINLLRNAKHACEESDNAIKQITLRAANSNGTIKISVIDNGSGIAPENLARIFNHGFTTRKSGHGFGLHSGSLAAREMGGELRVESLGQGNGATFTLELPLAPRGKPEAQAI
jgi:signal transduction histidine kinase